MTAPTSMFASSPTVAQVLDLAPDLGRDLSPRDLADAGTAARARLVQVRRGPWSPPPTRPGDVGLLVVSGLVARMVTAGRRESLELLGPGDLLRPGEDEESDLIKTDVRWELAESASFAVLDARFAHVTRHWPEIGAALTGRAARRAKWLDLQCAITSHPAVEDRLLLLFCHLGERLGRVTAHGVALDLPLTQRRLAQCVGALRPTVTTALLRLRERGRLERPAPRRWVITADGLAHAESLGERDVIGC